VTAAYQERGHGPSPFGTEELARLVHLDPRPWSRAFNEPSRLLADLEFAKDRPARLELDAGADHQSLGSGLQLSLMIPVEPDAAIAQRLNAREAREPDAHQLGAWCVDDTRGLCFSAFVPSAAYLPNLLHALIYHQSARNDWARDELFGGT
jgi:hypothetical protein